MTREARVSLVLAGLSLLLLSGLGARFYVLQVTDHSHYRAKKVSQSWSQVIAVDKRRYIVDINGAVLAGSIPVKSAFIDPSLHDKNQVPALAAILEVPAEEMARKLSDPEKRFVWLKRKISEEEVPLLKKFRGVGITTEYKRHYPNGRSMGHILGFVDIDDRGLEGVEKMYEAWLAPEKQTLEALMDAAKRIVARHAEVRDAHPRGDVVLTINLDLQKIVEEELNQAIVKYRPQSACAIAMNPKTGAILAMVVHPDFDPSHPGRYPAEARRNRVLTDPYEPGSVVKSFVIARALELGKVTPETVIHCENGAFRFGPRVLHDHHPYGNLSVTEILAKSSNIGATKVGILLGKEGVWRALSDFGFGRPSGIDMAGESPGKLTALARWTDYTLTSVPMGHEMMATPLQILRGYCAFANGGILVTPHVLCEVVDEGYVISRPLGLASRRVLDEQAAETVKRMLVETVANGTAKAAKVEGMTVAGKTGTTQVIDRITGRYRHDLHIGSFVGFAPAEDPSIAMIVVLDRPQGESYGGTVAAPVVGRVLSRAQHLVGKDHEASALRREILQGYRYR